MTSQQKLSIDTPEQIKLEYELAGLGSRFMALVVDSIIQAIAIFVLGIILVLTSNLHPFGHNPGNWAIAIGILLLFALQWSYFVTFEILWQGQTPGKRQAEIRVINETGRAASAYEAITRNLLRIVDALPGIYGVGVIVMFLSPQSKRVGDYVAGTVVVHDRKQDTDGFFLIEKQESVADINYSALTTEDLQVMETFLSRRFDLPEGVRRSTATKLAQYLREKCAVAAGTVPDDETLLAMLIRGYRQIKRN